ncbi:protein binding, partial [Zea mays]
GLRRCNSNGVALPPQHHHQQQQLQQHGQQPGVGGLVDALVLLAHRRVRLRRQRRRPPRRRPRPRGGRLPRLLHVLHGAQARRRVPQVRQLRPPPPQPQRLRLRSPARPYARSANCRRGIGGRLLRRRQSCVQCKPPLFGSWLEIFHKN